MTSDDAMRRIDALVSHVWMVRQFLKHSEEAVQDADAREIQRELYDFALALGKPWQEQDSAEYLKLAKKKLARLSDAARRFAEIQPELSDHTNFRMASRSLSAAVADIGEALREA